MKKLVFSIITGAIIGILGLVGNALSQTVEDQERTVISVDKAIVSESVTEESVTVGLIASPILPVFPSER